jgi:hypothetical protein
MDSMDLGLGRFLEMFEARFGRKATTVLLAMIGLGIVAFTGRLILTGMVFPIYDVLTAIINRHETLKSIVEDSHSQTSHIIFLIIQGLFIGWITNNFLHDVYAFVRRRQIMREAETRLFTRIERVNIWKWIQDNKADVKEIITRLDNEEKGVGPIIDDAFLIPFLTRPDVSPLRAAIPPAEAPEPTSPPVGIPPFPMPPE